MPTDKRGHSDKKPTETPIDLSEPLELHPDAWERFERAVDKVAKSPPQHRTAKHPEKTKPAK